MKKTDECDETEHLNDAQMLERDKKLGRCPFCHGKNFLIDPVLGDKVPCVCADSCLFVIPGNN